MNGPTQISMSNYARLIYDNLLDPEMHVLHLER